MSDFSKHDITNLTWEQGSIGSSGNMNSTTRVRTPGYIPIHSKSSLTTSLQLYATSNLSRTINVNYMLYKEDKSLLLEDIWRANNEIKTFNVPAPSMVAFKFKRAATNIAMTGEMGVQLDFDRVYGGLIAQKV